MAVQLSEAGPIIGNDRWMRAIRTSAEALYPITAAVLLVLFWHYALIVFGVPHYVVPAPGAVATALYEQRALLATNMVPTAIEAVAGFLIGNLVGCMLAVLFVYSKILSRSLFPIIVFVKSIPIVAIAPILLIAFGFGYTPKVIVAALITFFPTLVNVMRGLKSADKQLVELCKICSASTMEVFVNVRIYSSLPYLFSALRVSAPASVIGAMISEWIGSRVGLGFLIVQTTSDYRTDLLYATIIVTAALALSLMASVVSLERYVIRWQPKEEA